VERRAIVATLILAGIRIGELCQLRWRSVDLANGWLVVDDAKTDAGRRRVKIRGALRDVLAEVRARAGRVNPDDYVFATRTGARPSRDNVRNRVLAPAARLATEQLIAAGLPPLPERVTRGGDRVVAITPHSLRRTFASVLYALGEDPGVVMDEMGHTDPALALRVYRQAMRRGEDEKARLRALVDGGELAVIGSRSIEASETAVERDAA
jgi:integrase